ncbi:MAG: FGGY-family carbohydrate kinase [Eubacteriales bacterium]|nr:FGGY-family carbohydrate kinase [Eubacteriales bacterium]
MGYLIGVDAGTTNVKAVLFNEAGEEVCISTLANEPIRIGDSYVEMDMNVLWSKTKECLSDLMKKSGVDKNEVAGIGITGQGEGCWLMDEKGEPVQNAILWCDARANAVIRELKEKSPALVQKIFSVTGTETIAGTQLMLLKWMQENRQDVLDRASTMFFCKDWLRYKLTGKIGADYTDSGTSLLDTKQGVVAKEVLEELGLGKYISYIPEPVNSDKIFANVKKEVAEEIGLREEMPIITGAIDVCSSAVGTGAIHRGDICVVLGTTCANEVILQKEDCVFGEEGSRYEKHPLGDLFLSLQPTMNGTPNIDWMLDNISLTKDFSEIDAIVESEPVGCGGVIYSPYISVAGERAPFHHPYARANFFGISQPTTRNTLIRAVYEGVSLSIRDCLNDTDRDGKIFLAGGGAKSKVWAQMIADVMRMPVYIADGQELGAKGCAIMAGVQLGMFEDYNEAIEKMCHVTCIYEPRANHSDKYDLIYELYRMIREVNVPLWDKRHQITKQLKTMR